MSSSSDVVLPRELQRNPASDSLYLSTEDLPERDRLAIWHELHGRTLFNLGMAPHAGSPFKADATINRIQDIAMATVNSSRVQYYTDRGHLQNAQDSIAIFTVQRGKAHGKQNGRDAIIGPGEGFAILNNEMASVNVMEDGRYLTIYVPRHVVAPLVPDIEHAIMQPMALNSSSLKLLMGYAAALQENVSKLDVSLRHNIAMHLGDLTANVLGANGDAGSLIASRGLRAARLRAIKEDILANLADHDLSAETVARRQGITSRYIRKLLDSDGTSFSDLVLTLRLTHAHRLLCDPRHLVSSVGTIAYEVGFGDLSYFNRTFRRQFGMTPSDARAEAARRRLY